MNYPDYSFNHHYYHQRPDLRQHYLDEGQQCAETIVMLHGNPTWSYYYRKLVTALRDQYRCIVPDHIGMGLSDKPDEQHYSYTLAQRVNDLTALLEHLKITNDITLVLHDWGGMIGLAWACRHADRLRRLIVFNTSAFLPAPDKAIPWQLRLSRIPMLGPLLNQGLNIFSRAAIRLCVTRAPLPPEVATAYLAPYSNWSQRRAIQKFIMDIPFNQQHDSWSTVQRVSNNAEKFNHLPTLVCWGMKDFIFDHHILQQWQQHFADAEFHYYQDAGHYILEDAAEQIIPLVQAFLRRHPLSP